MNELEEKIMMLEELFQGFVERIKVLENDLPKHLESFLQAYKESMCGIQEQIELSNKRYDHSKIQQNIDEVKKILSSTPKVITVKNSHYFGAWSKSFMIGVAISFFFVASSVGYSCYLYHKNSALKSEAFNFWLIRGLYPVAAQAVIDKFQLNPDETIALTKRAIEKQHLVKAAKLKAEEAEKQRKVAEENLKNAQSAK